jgi:hypothetical protein
VLRDQTPRAGERHACRVTPCDIGGTSSHYDALRVTFVFSSAVLETFVKNQPKQPSLASYSWTPRFVYIPFLAPAQRLLRNAH